MALLWVIRSVEDEVISLDACDEGVPFRPGEPELGSVRILGIPHEDHSRGGGGDLHACPVAAEVTSLPRQRLRFYRHCLPSLRLRRPGPEAPVIKRCLVLRLAGWPAPSPWCG